MTDMEEQIEEALDVALKAVPKVAKICRKLYECLIDEGFTPEEALTVLKSGNTRAGR